MLDQDKTAAEDPAEANTEHRDRQP
jgi:hypothetical protein